MWSKKENKVHGYEQEKEEKIQRFSKKRQRALRWWP
jgi:hypothetical protein